MFIEDFMTPNPLVARPDMPLAQAQAIMQKNSFRHLPVLDKADRLVGILSDRDVRSAVGYDKALEEKLTVSEVMTADPKTIGAAATLDEALAILRAEHFSSLPVMRNEELVGILTRRDLLCAFYVVLGLDESGKRLEIALPNGFADLSLAFQALATCQHEVRSAVVSRMRRDGGEPALYLRVEPGCARQVESQLRAATLIVLVPEHS